MKAEQKDEKTGKVLQADIPDPVPLTQAELDAREKADLKDRITQKAVVELVKILVSNGTIKLTDFSNDLKAMVQRYNQL